MCEANYIVTLLVSRTIALFQCPLYIESARDRHGSTIEIAVNSLFSNSEIKNSSC